jgi:hypothetical protein
MPKLLILIRNQVVAVSTIVSLLFLCSSALGQVDTGIVLGSVLDSTGAVIPEASITLTNQAQGTTLTTKTNGEGNYQFPVVRAGMYSVGVEAPGFKQSKRENVSVSIQQRAVVDFRLQPGALTQSVDVTSDAAQLQTQDASLGGVVHAQTINDLPLNGRNYTFLAQLEPGVVQGQQDSRGMASSGSFSANGQNSFSNNYLLDGVDNNSNLVDFINGAGYVYRPSVDALQEFKVQTSSYSAEFGRAGGAILNASIKSGTDKFHGNFFEFFRNAALNANNFFANYQGLPKGKLIRNQFGATLGGPVSPLNHGQRKTFFFMDYEGFRQRQATTSLLTAPTALMQSSNFTDMSDLIKFQGGTRKDALGRTFALGTIMDPATTRLLQGGSIDPVTGMTVPGSPGSTFWVRDPIDPTCNALVSGPNPGCRNQIPASRMDANALHLLQQFPAATRSDVLSGNYAVNPVTQDGYNQGDLRIDQYLSEKDSFFGRFSMGGSNTLVPAPYGGVIDGSQFGGGNQSVKVHSEAGSWTHIFGPKVVLESRFGYSGVNHTRLPFNAGNFDIAPSFGLSTPNSPNMGGLPTFTVDGLGQFGVPQYLPSIETQNTLQLSSTATVLAGNHSIKFGIQYSRPEVTFFQPAAPRGAYTYSSTFTDVANTSGGGTGMAQMLLTPRNSTVVGMQPCANTAVAPCAANFVGGPNGITATRIPTPTPTATWSVWGGFIEDTWRLAPKLTAVLGLRYDLQRDAPAPQGRGANLVIEPDQNNPAQAASATYYIGKDACKTPLSSTFLSQAATDNVQIKCASSNQLVTSPHTMFAPRVGLAYNFLQSWVARAGFGMFYLTSGTSGRNGGNDLVATQNVYPFAYSVTINNFTPGQPVIYGDGSTGSFESGIASINVNDPSSFNASNLSLGGIPSPWKVPYTMQYNFTIQHQFSASQTVSIGYVGSQSRFQDLGFSSYNYNEPKVIAPPGMNTASFREFKSFNGMNQALNRADSNYNSLQVSYDKQFADGLGAKVSYTFSKCRTQGRQGLVNNIGGYRSLWLLGPDWALCDTDAPHTFVANAIYDLPFGQGKTFGRGVNGFVNQVIGNWQMTAIGTYLSGPPFSIGCNTTTTTGLGCNAVLTGQPLYPTDRNFNHWLNPAAFANPPVATTLGQSDLSPLGGSPTQVRGPDFRKLDFSLLKQFPLSGDGIIRESQRIEFRAEFFNLTNTPHFSAPGFSGGGAGLPAPPGVLDFSNTQNFGKITSLRLGAEDPRQIQLALKYYW